MITLKTNAKEVLTRVVLNLESLDEKGEIGSRIVRTVAFNVRAEMSNRIQLQGQDAKGGAIGQYDTKPLYVSAKQNPGIAFENEGKPYNGKRRSVFASGEPHRSRFFGGGYSEFKTSIGRNTLGKVNLTLSGDMMGNFGVFPTDKGWGLGWADTKYAKRARYFQDEKYQTPIFTPNTEEKRIARDTVKKMVKDALS